MDIAKLILSLPFKTRNADEFMDENILNLFVDPTDGVAGPFDYKNEIIKGKMGTGKTMYLRANYIYHLSILVPQMIDRGSLILPLYIKLSDFQNLHNPEKIYDQIIYVLFRKFSIHAINYGQQMNWSIFIMASGTMLLACGLIACLKTPLLKN